jgi:hypothetical protein
MSVYLAARICPVDRISGLLYSRKIDRFSLPSGVDCRPVVVHSDKAG